MSNFNSFEDDEKLLMESYKNKELKEKQEKEQLDNAEYICRYSWLWNGNCKFEVEAYSTISDKAIEGLLSQIKDKLIAVRESRKEYPD